MSLKDLGTTSLLALWIRVDLAAQKFSFEEARREISDSGWSAAVLVKAPPTRLATTELQKFIRNLQVVLR
jgi:hypothetical protein